MAVKALDIEEKIKYLKKAVELYQGPMFRSAKHEHWIMATSVSFEMRYLGAVSELMKALFKSMIIWGFSSMRQRQFSYARTVLMCISG